MSWRLLAVILSSQLQIPFHETLGNRGNVNRIIFSFNVLQGRDGAGPSLQIARVDKLPQIGNRLYLTASMHR